MQYKATGIWSCPVWLAPRQVPRAFNNTVRSNRLNDCTLFFSCAHIYVPIVFPASLSDILFEYFSLRLCFQQKFVKKNVKFQFLLIQDPLLFKQSYNIVNFRSSSLVKSRIQISKINIRGFTKFVIKVLWRLQFLE